MSLCVICGSVWATFPSASHGVSNFAVSLHQGLLGCSGHA